MTTTNDAPAPAPSGSGVRVKPLEFRECRSWGNSTKLIATDCFGNESARLDLRGQPDAEIAEFKAAAQSRYEACILSALASDASPRGELPVLPDDDDDFTPDLARKIIAGYQRLLRAHPAPATVEMLREAFDELRCRMLTITFKPDEPVVHVFDRCVEAQLAALAPATEGKKDKP